MSSGMRWYWLGVQVAAIAGGILGGRWLFDVITG